jgi:hypothetical protein
MKRRGCPRAELPATGVEAGLPRSIRSSGMERSDFTQAQGDEADHAPSRLHQGAETIGRDRQVQSGLERSDTNYDKWKSHSV